MPVGSLPTGQARLAACSGRALAARPSVLLLDSISASGLDETETADLARCWWSWLRPNWVVLLVEHDVGLVMQVCERIYVFLDFPVLVITPGDPESVRSNEAVVVKAYLGAGT